MTELSINMMIHAMPAPPQPITLARKRSWTEMNHLRALSDIPSPLLTAQLPTPTFVAKKSKRTLGSAPLDLCEDYNSACCRQCDGRVAGCAICSTECVLSDEAQRFLADDPFDFEALPHPVLKRQHAVHAANDCAFTTGAPVEPMSDSDDDMVGQELSMVAIKPIAPRWNASVVGASLAHVGRRKSATLLPRRM